MNPPEPLPPTSPRVKANSSPVPPGPHQAPLISLVRREDFGRNTPSAPAQACRLVDSVRPMAGGGLSAFLPPRQPNSKRARAALGQASPFHPFLGRRTEPGISLARHFPSPGLVASLAADPAFHLALRRVGRMATTPNPDAPRRLVRRLDRRHPRRRGGGLYRLVPPLFS